MLFSCHCNIVREGVEHSLAYNLTELRKFWVLMQKCTIIQRNFTTYAKLYLIVIY